LLLVRFDLLNIQSGGRGNWLDSQVAALMFAVGVLRRVDFLDFFEPLGALQRTDDPYVFL
jgi:hypothetical protein